ncbi:MAG: hypothetical protein GMKNLPBB_01248 [Myxococcota bacterium]|nr:hypothetical protein [Myxococcota bacterium]
MGNPEPVTQGEQARQLGRGALFIAASKIYFLFAGFALVVGLQRLLGPELYGKYTVVNEMVTLLGMMLIAGARETTSKFVSAAAAPGPVVRSMLRRMAAASLIIGSAWVLLTPVITGGFFRDPALRPPAWIAVLVLLSYPIYGVFIGRLNGERRFFAQAAFDSGFTTLKMALMLALVWLGFGVNGAMAGFGLTAVSMLLIAAWRVGAGEGAGEAPAVREFAAFASGIVLFTVVFNLMLKVDVFALKRLSPPESADQFTGVYGAAMNLGRIPYQGSIAVTLVLFPVISRLTSEKNLETVRAAIRDAIRYSLLLVLPIAAPLTAFPEAAVLLISGARYQGAGAALQWLAPAHAAMSVFYLCASVASGAGMPRRAVELAALALALETLAVWLLIPSQGFEGAAAGVFAAMILAALAGLLFVRRTFQAPLPWASIMRTAVILGACRVLGMLIPLKGFAALAAMAMVSLAALGMAVLLGELTESDRRRLRAVLARMRRQ